jgi:hypothetical protein
MTLSQIRENIYSRYLAVQRLKRLIDSDIFELAYSKADEAQKTNIQQLIRQSDVVSLKSLILKIGRENLEDRPIMELRQLGRKYGIKHYNNMPKTHLVEEIRNAIGTVKVMSSGNETVCPDVRSRGV